MIFTIEWASDDYFGLASERRKEDDAIFYIVHEGKKLALVKIDTLEELMELMDRLDEDIVIRGGREEISIGDMRCRKIVVYDDCIE